MQGGISQRTMSRFTTHIPCFIGSVAASGNDVAVKHNDTPEALQLNEGKCLVAVDAQAGINR